ncbi:hypothetical protein GC722_01095 [Auraticoccus sp. F435]|uniref:Glycine zipper domain-containing protein n=1 Tax=Auraticoccus cholistanensis TaxID=2656650 RepID=A0A6A9UZY3_9ACTN|nr:hypothetical protein [Auraticoccus cholistanensis]
MPTAARLQFRLRGFAEHESTDTFIQGASDEVFLSAIGTDSAAVLVGPDHQPTLELKHSGTVGDVSEDRVRNPWKQNPHVLLDFDLRRPSDWPRSMAVTLLLVEEDNQKIGETFSKLHSEVGGVVRQAAVKAASTAAGALAGAAIGSVIPGIGTAVGAAVGGIAGATYDVVIEAISEGLKNEAFTPITLTILVQDPAELGRHPKIGVPQFVQVGEHGARYTIEYDWHLA